ncbi:hypothetical protein D3C73_1599630 [compost metagenome]
MNTAKLLHGVFKFVLYHNLRGKGDIIEFQISDIGLSQPDPDSFRHLSGGKSVQPCFILIDADDHLQLFLA